MITAADQLKTVLVTDCGSTTTKALLFERKAEGWRQTYRGESPTTVEEPVADVTVGARNSFTEVQELSGRQILDSSPSENPFKISAKDPSQGIDLYLSTSSAGGGLQMMVGGIVKSLSRASAFRAASGAGAIVLDSISFDDGRQDHERIQRMRTLRPDIILLAGGIEGGSKTHAIELAEMILAAAPTPRFGDTLKLPVVYAGNSAAASEVQRLLHSLADLAMVKNVRPELDREDLGPARDAVHEFFLSHVMSHSPGYGKLLRWTPVPIMPTPAAVGEMVQNHARLTKKNVLCADIGGATTDVFSAFFNDGAELIYNRTVSANYGMSYSIAHVLLEAGAQRIARWLPYALSPDEVRDRLRNKMIRPTSIPETEEDLWLEQAVCREALRLSLEHHRALAVNPFLNKQKKGIASIFKQKALRDDLVDTMKLDVVIGSGGVLSHAPRRMQAALMMLEGFELQGLTELCVDSIFMMPHLGVFASVHPQAAQEIFLKDCLISLGYGLVPVWDSFYRVPEVLAEVEFKGERVPVQRGRCAWVKQFAGESGELTLRPLHRRVNLGAGPGNPLKRSVNFGECGLLIDGRNRPLSLPSAGEVSVQMQRELYSTFGLLGDVLQ